MSSIVGVISRQREDVYPFILDMLYSTKHRGLDHFGIEVKNKDLRVSSLKQFQEGFLEGSIGLGYAESSLTNELFPAYFSHPSFSLISDSRIFNASELNLDFSSNIISKAKEFSRKAIGSFAVGLKKANSLYVFRDFLGAKPLWFGLNEEFFAFASEPNALKKLNITFPQALKQGHLIKFDGKKIVEEKLFDLNDFKNTLPKKTSLTELKHSFDLAIDRNTTGVKKAGVFFSAGIDSSLIAKAVSEKVKDTTLYTVGLEGAQDIFFSKKLAKELGLKLKVRLVEEDEIASYAFRTLKELNFFDELQLMIALPEFIAGEQAKKDGCRVVFSGQGSDEVFCGYASYCQILREGGYPAVEREIWNSLHNLWSRNLFREDAISMKHSLDLRTPFLDSDFLRHAMAFPVKEKILSPEDKLRKHPVRKLGQLLGLPKDVCSRPKKALQYGSGLGKAVSKLFKTAE